MGGKPLEKVPPFRPCHSFPSHPKLSAFTRLPITPGIKPSLLTTASEVSRNLLLPPCCTLATRVSLLFLQHLLGSLLFSLPGALDPRSPPTSLPHFTPDCSNVISSERPALATSSKMVPILLSTCPLTLFYFSPQHFS